MALAGPVRAAGLAALLLMIIILNLFRSQDLQ